MSGRLQTIEEIAEPACTRAIGYNRVGRRGRAEYELVRAGMKIARIVNDVQSLTDLSQLHLFEPFHDARRGDLGGAA